MRKQRQVQPVKRAPKSATPTPSKHTSVQALCALATAIDENVTEELSRLTENFSDTAMPEEKRFMIDVLRTWENNGGGYHPGHPIEYQVHIYSAIQCQMDFRNLVRVPDDNMVQEVEEFISKLIKAGWEAQQRSWHDPDVTVEERLGSLVNRNAELFTMTANVSSLHFMLDLIQRWHAIATDPEVRGKSTNYLAAAAQIELDVLAREESLAA